MKISKELHEKLCGVWSAAPTPFNKNMEIDREAVEKMVEHHIKIGINGLFLLGTNGEGPCLTEKQKLEIVKQVVKCNKGKMVIAVQITDNSSQQMLENARKFSDTGIDIFIISSPYFFVRPEPKRILNLYESVLKNIHLPVGIYDRGKHSAVEIPLSVLKKLYTNKKIIIIKDSSSDETRMQLALMARRKNRNLRLFNGNEFQCVKYLQAGYDGLLLGGGIFNGHIASQIINAVKTGNIGKAEKLQKLMNKIMYAAYGGKKVQSWLAGEKYLLMKMGIFNTWNNLYQYTVDAQCEKTIDKIYKQYKNLLIPY
ncbi:MAG TPA: dihydrodipicolinate synthase family protein [bacterium]|nr:dihydrodipicolinate synthase family protein [bacterium]HOL49436.1 dihydrodipicolinate synthase family protein [bacterium]HPO51643.1 dihydrodipicolinate synthase family protein [bacterium]HXK44446.1 dihydrodipicolinate synthase family protein [bacterium]